MKHFYRIENEELYRGVGAYVPDGFIEYSIEEIPSELEPFLQEEQKTKRLARLNKIFRTKLNGLKAIPILTRKPFLKTKEEVQEQTEVYENMYQNAIEGYYDDATNAAIIQANKTTKAQLAPFLLLLNNARDIVVQKIEANNPSVDSILDYIDGIKLKQDDLTQEKVQEIMQNIGAENETYN